MPVCNYPAIITRTLVVMSNFRKAQQDLAEAAVFVHAIDFLASAQHATSFSRLLEAVEAASLSAYSIFHISMREAGCF